MSVTAIHSSNLQAARDDFYDRLRPQDLAPLVECEPGRNALRLEAGEAAARPVDASSFDKLRMRRMPAITPKLVRL